MAVYLEVVPTHAKPTSGASQVLEGSQCLVFYLGGVPTASSAHPGGMNVLLCDGSVRFAKDLSEIAAAIARMPIAGVSTIIIGPATQPGYLTTRWQLTSVSKELPGLGLTSAGGQAVLIGLLLPAVQAARDAAVRKAPSSGPIAQLKSLVGPRGHVFVIGNQGELLTL
jgi:prepilin-type processing-associated H-X9-DG protein